MSAMVTIARLTARKATGKQPIKSTSLEKKSETISDFY